MTLEEIRKDVEHCLSIEDEKEPCYHCRQKLFLLKRIDELTRKEPVEVGADYFQVEPPLPAGTDSYGSLPDPA